MTAPHSSVCGVSRTANPSPEVNNLLLEIIHLQPYLPHSDVPTCVTYRSALSYMIKINCIVKKLWCYFWEQNSEDFLLIWLKVPKLVLWHVRSKAQISDTGQHIKGVLFYHCYKIWQRWIIWGKIIRLVSQCQPHLGGKSHNMTSMTLFTGNNSVNLEFIRDSTTPSFVYHCLFLVTAMLM